MKNERILYPFSALVGQEDMKKALILNLINPSLGGVLIRGEKGTAKSTAVRGLIDILPSKRQVKGCRFSCVKGNEDNWCIECKEKKDIEYVDSSMKVINLPVSATEDRVVGTLDIEKVIKRGEKAFEQGILAEANGNILYIDEVNLLDDHLVDVLLDAAAMGVNIIEREGVSYSHPSRFVLVGTMNPEEGNLRPQLIDRFGLVVDVRGESQKDLRMEVMKRRLEFEKDPTEFKEKYSDEDKVLIKKIDRAKKLLNDIKFTDYDLSLITKISTVIGIDGHRGDITLIKTAITNAAFMGRESILKEDIYEAAKLALPHRVRRNPFEEGVIDFEYIKKIIDDFPMELKVEANGV
ncbi:ATP-binding protein [Senegalia sp. (in: firmicutes)]|uniref:ATP-binding protein n=1 Tax=Senegalia sp. (in: firmicutes) TaxID=1924098 RepID=UPI003F943B3E